MGCTMGTSALSPCSDEKYTPAEKLDMAVQRGSMFMVETLCSRHPSLVGTAFVGACKFGHSPIVSWAWRTYPEICKTHYETALATAEPEFTKKWLEYLANKERLLMEVEDVS